MATITWVVLKHHKKADGTYNPKIRITHNRSVAYMLVVVLVDVMKHRAGLMDQEKEGTVVTEPS